MPTTISQSPVAPRTKFDDVADEFMAAIYESAALLSPPPQRRHKNGTLSAHSATTGRIPALAWERLRLGSRFNLMHGVLE
jgi:hypothetical protein